MTNVNINETLHKRFKSKCALAGSTMTDILDSLIKEWLKKQDEPVR